MFKLRRGFRSGLVFALLLIVLVALLNYLTTTRLIDGAEQTSRTRDIVIQRIAQLVATAASIAIIIVVFRRLRRENELREQSETMARESEARLATALDSIGDGVITTDRNARVVWLNPVAARLTGWSPEEARGKPFSDVVRIIEEITGEPATDPVAEVLREKRAVDLAHDIVLLHRDGTRTSIAESAAPILDTDHEVIGVVLVLRDAGRERAWTDKLRDTNRFLDSIVENIPNMVFVKDAADLRFVRFNRAGEKLLGLNRDQLIGKSDRDLFPAEQADAFQSKDREVLAHTDVFDIPEEPIDTPSGQRWLHTRKIPITDDDGAPLFLLGISEDITLQKQAADQLRAMNDELERRVRERTAALEATETQLRQSQKLEAIGRLAGGIAHDFNNLLSVILSYSEMLVSELAAGPTRDDIEEIYSAGKRAADLTRQLLAFSRQQVLAPRIVDVNELLAGMDRLLRRVIGEDIELRTLNASKIGKIKVDPGQLEQVIMNLVVNARDAMPRGGTVTIETTNVELDDSVARTRPGIEAGPYVMLAVTDTGVGMDQETQARIFEPFFTTKPKGKGTGLGLSTVFGIVKQSGGSVWFYSEPGTGTTFKIYFPLSTEVADRKRATSQVLPKLAGTETILLVEDEGQVRALARTVLAKSGYQVLEATNGEDALMLCARFTGKIHLVLTDVVMPKMSGRELVENLQKLRPESKVLFMSGYTDDTVVHHGVLDEGVAFLQKPITPDALTRKIREVLDAQ